MRAILILESGESFAGALDKISYSGVTSFQDGSGENTWKIELFYLRGTSLDTNSLEFSEFEKRQAKALIVFKSYNRRREYIPEDVLLILNENAQKMGIAYDLVKIMRLRMETARSVLNLIQEQMAMREPVTAEQS